MQLDDARRQSVSPHPAPNVVRSLPEEIADHGIRAEDRDDLAPGWCRDKADVMTPSGSRTAKDVSTQFAAIADRRELG